MIQIIGISHNTANLETREKYTFSNSEIIAFSNVIQLEGEIDEIVVLSTCNRTEFYFSQNGRKADKAFEYLLEKLAEYKNISPVDSDSFYRYTDQEAIYHLFKVSAGLDSMLFGEDQIIGQVKEAYLFSTEMGYTEAILMRLFQKSFEAGKRVRSETLIKTGTTSISHLAVEIVKRELGELNQAKMLVIGAGKAASLIVSTLKKNKATEIIIANRTSENAQKLLKDYSGSVVTLNDITNVLPTCDAVISATGTQNILINTVNIESSGKQKQVFVDISVPSSIEKPTQPIAGKKVYQIDDLKAEAKRNAENRKLSLGAAEEIIQQTVDEYLKWYACRVLRPAIKTITSNLKTIGKAELSEFQKGNTKEVQDAIETYNNHLTRKYTRAFIKNLKEIKEESHSGNYLEVIERLFKIPN